MIFSQLQIKRVGLSKYQKKSRPVIVLNLMEISFFFQIVSRAGAGTTIPNLEPNKWAVTIDLSEKCITFFAQLSRDDFRRQISALAGNFLRDSKDFAERLNFCTMCTPLHVFSSCCRNFLIDRLL